MCSKITQKGEYIIYWLAIWHIFSHPVKQQMWLGIFFSILICFEGILTQSADHFTWRGVISIFIMFLYWYFRPVSVFSLRHNEEQVVRVTLNLWMDNGKSFKSFFFFVFFFFYLDTEFGMKLKAFCSNKNENVMWLEK